MLGREWFPFILKLDLCILVWVSSPGLIQNVALAELSDRGMCSSSVHEENSSSLSPYGEGEERVHSFGWRCSSGLTEVTGDPSWAWIEEPLLYWGHIVFITAGKRLVLVKCDRPLVKVSTINTFFFFLI